MILRLPTVIKPVRKDFSRSLEMTRTVISNKVRDLTFPDFQKASDVKIFNSGIGAFLLLSWKVLAACAKFSDGG
jgi:hypothetical protein